MSKKKLLEESTIRSFMKLANLQPLTSKFLKESDDKDEDDEETVEEAEKADDEETVTEEVVEEEADALEEKVEEEGEAVEEGKESEGRPASKKEAPKGTSLAGKPQQGIDGAKSVKSPGKLKPVKKTSNHSTPSGNVKPSSEVGGKSNASDRKPNRGEFEVVSESLEEETLETEADEMGGETPSDAAGESGDHQAKVKGVIQGILSQLQDLAGEYGIEMDVASDEGGDEGEAAPPEDMEAPEGGDEEGEEPVMEAGHEKEKMEEMVERLTKRVAARLVKESKKKR